MKANTLRKGCLPVIILIAALGVARFMIVHRVTPEKVEIKEMITPVEIVPVVFETTQIVLPAQGTVTSAVQVSVRPETSGKITRVSPNLVPGGSFVQDEMMFQIDTRDYSIIVANQKQALAAAELALKQEEARGRVARREWDLLGDSFDKSTMDKDLALRLPQLKQAQAAVEAARKNLEKARLDLARCTVRAPFNGLVIAENVDPGQVITTGAEAAILSGTDEYWVQLSVPVDNLRFINFDSETSEGSQVIISQTTGNGAVKREGRIIRLLGNVGEMGRMARLLVSIPDPLKIYNDHDLPLLIGSYVKAEIQGKTLDHVVRIHRSALHFMDITENGKSIRQDAVWIMNSEDRLELRPVTVDWRTDEEVYIHNSLQPGQRLITSNIATPVEGMQLVLRSNSDAGQKDPDDEN